MTGADHHNGNLAGADITFSHQPTYNDDTGNEERVGGLGLSRDAGTPRGTLSECVQVGDEGGEQWAGTRGRGDLLGMMLRFCSFVVAERRFQWPVG